ncbi:probable serine carboxypeptidase CPVL [Biomphalaria glabrata]|uniref:Probable serine carboxypeptidase CPVL n=1 Tax=Biomphalaria glabrata TaxID=6526 RepID=A0A9W2YE42_BIOGL|nr:probable serine carboxypeptidase CPVL [Biomphalaria glabrata]
MSPIPVKQVILLILISNTLSFEVDKPLKLTPYLKQGKITTARQLSLVKDKKNGVIPTSYSGFITVDQHLGNHLFFWFFPAINSDPKAPLVVWLNGGPGESSMIGLINENGPLKIDKLINGNISYRRRKNSWAETFSMLYIDNPVGVGYSYSDSGEEGYRTTQEEYTRDLYEFIQQFYVMFPEYLQRELYIGGQSYAGKYVPAFAYKIHEEIQAKRTNIPLKGIHLGGPLIDAKIQFGHFFEIFFSLGFITYDEFLEFQKEIIKEFPKYEQNKSLEIFNLLMRLSGLPLDNFNTLDRSPDEAVTSIMTNKNLRSLLHVGKADFKAFNENVYLRFGGDLFVSTRSQLGALMDNYKVLVYTGDLDGLISSPTIEAVLRTTPWSLMEEYKISKRQSWLDGDIIKGFYTRVGLFCRVIVLGAGHRASFDQPDSILKMMNSFVTTGCI